MNIQISLDSLWHSIEGLPIKDRQWLSDKLIENLKGKEVAEPECEYISKEEILKGIESGLKEYKAGKGKDFDEFIKEMERERHSLTKPTYNARKNNNT